ncbi:hypothetical protein D3C86_1038710 [compost metagenome]
MLAPGCFCTLRITAGRPFTEASPRLIMGAKRTSATCLRVTGTPFRTPTTVASMSAGDLARPRFRIMNSWPCFSTKPPVVFWLLAETAFSTSSRLKPYCLRRSGLTCTWYWRTPPPMLTTWATPGMVNRRWRTTQSAQVRTSIGSMVSELMPISMISPMIEAMGPMAGVTVSGRRSLAIWSFSETIWRSL